MEETKEKICRDCTYYVPYYVKKADHYFLYFCGRCENRRKRKNNFKETDKTCEYFETKNREEEKAIHIKAIQKALPDAISRLNEICDILKDSL